MATWASDKQKPFPVSVTPQVSVSSSSSAFPAQFIDRGCGAFVLGSWGLGLLGSTVVSKGRRLEGDTENVDVSAKKRTGMKAVIIMATPCVYYERL